MEDTQVSSVGKAQIQLKVDGMCCADEVAQVEDALKKLDGVREVQASIVAGAEHFQPGDRTAIILLEPNPTQGFKSGEVVQAWRALGGHHPI
jgi:copper chaperone CopZ